jgi:heme-degrading monooxygenase HmoA
MIARTWHGTVRSEQAAAYGEYLRKTGVADLEATEGNRGVYVLRHDDRERTHFVLITLWHSLNDIRAFAGDDIERARYYPEDPIYLLELEPQVTHYEVLVQPEPADFVAN